MHKPQYYSAWTYFDFWYLTFPHGHFIMGAFQHEDILAQEQFGMVYFSIMNVSGDCVSAQGMLCHWDISAQGYFSTWTFWHMYILALCIAI
jgi:hypothetical protein